jgi:hypothetical protein
MPHCMTFITDKAKGIYGGESMEPGTAQGHPTSNSQLHIRVQYRVVALSRPTNPSKTVAKLLEALAESFESMFCLNCKRPGPCRDSLP